MTIVMVSGGKVRLIREKAMIRITKIFHFEAAHLLVGYKGPCKNIHGHSYELHVTLAGLPVNNPSSPSNGMVMEFSELKNRIQSSVLEEFDHSLIIPSIADKKIIDTLKKTHQKLVITSYQPTCENLLQDFASRIQKKLPRKISLQRLKLAETPASYAEWRREDQATN
ncbi:MAG: 6-pyruvoyl trahydropterin synthase family protein [Bacteroidia bacterium]